MLSTLDQIIALSQLGMRVHPLSVKNKIPLLDDWTRKASAEEEVIRKWDKKYPNCNWGLATGVESGVFVVDIDPKNGGDRTWAEMLKKNGVKTIKTVETVTGTRGTHIYFLYPKNTVVTNSGIGKGVDIRGEGGNIVLPPSIHPNGNTYVWAKGKSPEKAAIAKAPAWLIKLIKAAAKVDFPTIVGQKIPRGERNNTIFHQALLLARQDALYEFTVSTMKAWVRNTKEFDMNDKEIEATVESAYRFYESEKSKKKEIGELELSDVGNVRRLLKDHGANVKYAVGLGYHIWDDRRWAYDEETLKTKQLAIKSMDALRDEAVDELKSNSDKTTTSALLKVHQWAVNSHNAARLGAIVDIAKSYPQILTTHEDLDGDNTAFMLNFANGILDLKTGRLFPHNKEMLITRLIEHEYHPNAKCPTWLKTLELAFNGDKELIKYFQRAVGYSISGDMSEQCFFICWGSEGNNGKSTMLEALQRILGTDYAVMSDARVISSRDKDNHVLSSLALLNKVRMVSVNEFGEMAVLDEELIKQLTGGDTVQAKRLYMAPFTFRPIFKIWVRANAKPIVHGTGNAFWRRVKLIPFEHSIPEKYRRPRHEIDAALQSEAEGILAWAVKGFQDWYENGGLRDPQIVTQASAVYRNESDSVNTFWEECIDAIPSSELPRSTLYQVFREWSQQQGVKYVMTSDKFTRRVSAKLQQFDRTRNNSGIAVWKGVSLNKHAIMTFGGI